MKTLIIIPSRMSAKRLPGKPLLKINGISVISHVFKRAEKANIGDVVVAAEDKEIIVDNTKDGFDPDEVMFDLPPEPEVDQEKQLEEFKKREAEELEALEEYCDSMGLQARGARGEHSPPGPNGEFDCDWV